MSHYINVLLPIATGGVYTYISSAAVPAGARVSVPIGRRTATGICIGTVAKPEFECRDITAILDDTPLFSSKWLELVKRISEYYATPLGLTLHGVLSNKLIASTPPDKEYEPVQVPVTDIVLNNEQADIANAIAIDVFSAHLLYGVTSSGKTEIYLDLIKKVINNGKKAIYLVPEISLTPQLVERVAARLGIKPELFHSKLGDKKRSEAFWHFSRGKAPVIIGPRSALFVPTDDLGIIIVDEEHESTYKQDEAPSYHLRDMAVLYAQLYNIPVVLGSATPQVESMANAKSGKYILHHLHNRAGGASMPDLCLIDTKKYSLIGEVIAEPVYDELCKTVSKGEQAIIFLNRKGYATSLYCRKCGILQECLNCSVPLTMYKNGKLICRYCGEEYRNHKCPSCESTDIASLGAGTERVEEFLENMFPGKVQRLDADKITSLKKLDSILKDFYDKKSQILVGTQLIAKGLHFPEVTFVGILGIDNILAMPDFRSTEKAYQLLMQVSGRAGRGASFGTVYIQTNMPDNQLFSLIMNNPESFYEYEIARRAECHYPPASKLARLVFTHHNEEALSTAAHLLTAQIRQHYPAAQVMGPIEAAVYKIKNNFRLSVIIKSNSNNYMKQLLAFAGLAFNNVKTGTMSLKIDRDPYFFM